MSTVMYIFRTPLARSIARCQDDPYRVSVRGWARNRGFRFTQPPAGKADPFRGQDARGDFSFGDPAGVILNSRGVTRSVTPGFVYQPTHFDPERVVSTIT